MTASGQLRKSQTASGASAAGGGAEAIPWKADLSGSTSKASLKRSCWRAVPQQLVRIDGVRVQQPLLADGRLGRLARPNDRGRGVEPGYQHVRRLDQVLRDVV